MVTDILVLLRLGHTIVFPSPSWRMSPFMSVTLGSQAIVVPVKDSI